jgi:NIMA (never in mitosis gene a)-related kinase
MSPEQINENQYDEKTDIWSLGCVIYEICALNPPFKASSMDELFKKILKGKFSRIPPIYSEDLNHVIKKLINTDASMRPSCE